MDLRIEPVRYALMARFDMLEEQKKSLKGTKKSTVKRLWNRIAQDMIEDVTR